ncbi:rhomboid family intramembrane serine protease [Celeribacter neptunius]|uniref:Membrane associated serine protease, rhomboid family n=1 Tax=Celeribacter neptunius TaxID=588602 RepID=A0A1I3SBM7_9RHOB|nr:rhomboid family intramembrane serine protease [Celeribacter neptunius]SFJ55820.1 Membrane associated serine protease, rhomboid family [Celeribacter neptunius]
MPRPKPRAWPKSLILLLMLNILPELVFDLFVLSSQDGLAAILRTRLYQYLAFWPSLLSGAHAGYPGQALFMFLTYGFLHAGLAHLTINMITLVSLSRPLLESLGSRRFMSLYLIGIIGGAGGYALLATQPQPMVGASGALFGLAGALLWERAVEDLRDLGLWETLRGLAFPLLWLVLINVVMYVAFNGHLAWEAHLGGCISGAIAMAWLMHRRKAQGTD